MKAYHPRRYADAQDAWSDDALAVRRDDIAELVRQNMARDDRLKDYVFYDLVPEQTE